MIGKLIKKHTSLSIAFLMLCLVFVGCEDTFDDAAFATDGSVNISSFNINGVEADIDDVEGKITAQLPYGTDLTAITPQLTIPEQASVTPSLGTNADFTSIVKYKVIHGNIYKTYEVAITSQKPILSFAINGLESSINHNSKMITLTVPEGTDVTQLEPVIELGAGVSISPNSGTTIDFSSPVVFTVSGQGVSEEYIAVVATPVDGPVVAFLGTSLSRQAITNLDEIAAANWLFDNYSGAVYISFMDIMNGTDLSTINVIWWHYDDAMNLPPVTTGASVTSVLQAYLSDGGNILLTTFASQYVDALGIVPSGKGPNNVFGDFPPNGFVDNGDWGMSFVGHEGHPLFEGLDTFAPGKANLLQGGTFRQNHTAWWFLPEWGGYSDGQGWRNQTGGTNLASEVWDDNLNGRVTIAEFPGEASDINAVVISMGAYDWYNENDASGNPSQPNGFIKNIRLLTANSINYLVEN